MGRREGGHGARALPDRQVVHAHARTPTSEASTHSHAHIHTHIHTHKDTHTYKRARLPLHAALFMRRDTYAEVVMPSMSCHCRGSHEGKAARGV